MPILQARHSYPKKSPPPTTAYITHHNETSGPPVSARTCGLGPDHLQVAHQEFNHMLELGIIWPSSSNWSSPLHMVPKKTPGDWHSCGDYRALNSRTVPDRYPILHIQDFTSTPAGSTIFSKINLVHAYHQILLNPQTSLKPLLSHCLICLNSYRCPASGMLHRLSSGSWTRFYKDCTAAMHISTF